MPLDPLFTPQELFEIRQNPQDTVSTEYWRSWFPRRFLSTQPEIRFDEIDETRRIAPFRLPMEPGSPIFRTRGEKVTAFKPAYIKASDPVVPGQMLALTPGEVSGRVPLMSLQQRFDRRTVEIVEKHVAAINRTFDFMCARALLDGSLTIAYDRDQGQPAHEVVLDFERDPAHTITLGAGARWGDAGVNVFDLLEEWINTVANAAFGGMVSDVILGSAAAKPFRASADIKDKLDNNFRGAEDVSINRGLVVSDPMNPFTLLGRLANGLRVWQISGPANRFQNDDETFTEIMDPRDCLLVSSAVNGVFAHGAILDHNAGFEPLDVYQRMFEKDDPAVRHILSQSAPLAIPVNPNATFKARVVA